MFCLLFPIQFSRRCGNETCEKEDNIWLLISLKNMYLYQSEYKLIFKTVKGEKSIWSYISWHLSSILFLSPTIITFWPAMNL